MWQNFTFTENNSEELFAKDKNHWKVRDHCHVTHKYRGVAHNICNLRFSLPN